MESNANVGKIVIDVRPDPVPGARRARVRPGGRGAGATAEHGVEEIVLQRAPEHGDGLAAEEHPVVAQGHLDHAAPGRGLVGQEVGGGQPLGPERGERGSGPSR